MAWFNRVDVTDPTEEPSISPDTEPSMLERLRTQNWFSWAIRGLAALIVIVIVLLGARAIHHHLNHSNSGASRPAFTDQKKQTAKTGSNTSNSGSKNQGDAGSSTSTSGSATLPTQVPNTGPGDVVAIFLGSALAAAGLHYIVNLRRADKS